jgi:hypothetical protein
MSTNEKNSYKVDVTRHPRFASALEECQQNVHIQHVDSDDERGQQYQDVVVVSHLQQRSALQAEKADHFELRKTTAGLLAAVLRPLELVGSRIWHRQTGAIDDFDASVQPELLVGNLAFELLGHLGANLLEHRLIEPCACPDSSRWYRWKANLGRESALETNY